MAKKSSAFSDAPPIKPPSTSGLEKISSAFAGFTLPPYSIETPLATSSPYLLASVCLINACMSWACSGLAVSPVPMAQTGS